METIKVPPSYFISTLHGFRFYSLPVLSLAFPELPEIPVSYSIDLQSSEEQWLTLPVHRTGLFVSSQTI